MPPHSEKWGAQAPPAPPIPPPMVMDTYLMVFVLVHVEHMHVCSALCACVQVCENLVLNNNINIPLKQLLLILRMFSIIQNSQTKSSRKILLVHLCAQKALSGCDRKRRTPRKETGYEARP